MRKFGYLIEMEDKVKAVDYIWDNFEKYIFSTEELSKVIDGLRNEINKGDWFEKLFNYEVNLFLKAFREFRVQRANIRDEHLDEYIDYVRSLRYNWKKSYKYFKLPPFEYLPRWRFASKEKANKHE